MERLNAFFGSVVNGNVYTRFDLCKGMVPLYVFADDSIDSVARDWCVHDEYEGWQASSWRAPVDSQVYAAMRERVREQHWMPAAWLVVLAEDKVTVQGYACFIFSPQQVARAFCFGEASKDVARKLVPSGKFTLKSLPLTTFEEAKKSIKEALQEEPALPQTAQVRPRQAKTTVEAKKIIKEELAAKPVSPPAAHLRSRQAKTPAEAETPSPLTLKLVDTDIQDVRTQQQQRRCEAPRGDVKRRRLLLKRI